MAKQVVNAALGGSRSVQRPWLGAKTQTVTPEIAASLGQRTPRGALVSDVWPGSAADKAGLKSGDIILKVGGQDVVDESGVTYYFAGRRVGEEEPLLILRGGQERTIAVRAEAAPGSANGDERAISGRNPLDGASIANFNPAMADATGLDPFAGKGVVVTKVGQGFAMEAGFRPGDFLVAINGQPVTSVSQVNAILGSNPRGWRVTILRGGQQITADFRL
jgi:S1-C subfamily serine protease